jgi:hypothetical protein
VSQDNPDNPIKARLMAEMHTAKEELQRAKTLLNAASDQAQTVEPDQPGGIRALTLCDGGIRFRNQSIPHSREQFC